MARFVSALPECNMNKRSPVTLHPYVSWSQKTPWPWTPPPGVSTKLPGFSLEFSIVLPLPCTVPASLKTWRGSQCLPLINRSGLVPGKVHIACAKCPKTVASRVENLGPMMYFLSPVADRTERSLLACAALHRHMALSTRALCAHLTVNQKICRVQMHAPLFLSKNEKQK